MSNNIDKNENTKLSDNTKPFIQNMMSTFGKMNNDDINAEFSKIDKQLDRKQLYLDAFQPSTKKLEYRNADYTLNGEPVGKMVNATVAQGGEGSMDYIFNFYFQGGESTENPYVRSKDIIEMV